MNAQGIFGWIIFALSLVAGVKIVHEHYQNEGSCWRAVLNFPLGMIFVYVMLMALDAMLWALSFTFVERYRFIPAWVFDASVIPIRSIFEWVVGWWVR